MCEPTDDWPCKFDGSLELERSGIDLSTSQTIQNAAGSPGVPGKGENDFTFPCGPTGAEDDDEVTESKIRAFLDEKVFCFQSSFFCELLRHHCFVLLYFISVIFLL